MSDLNLLWREKRDLGLLRRQLAWTLIELKLDGHDILSLPREQLYVLLIAEAQERHPETWDTVEADRDWESFLKSLLEFLEQVVPLILQIISIFL